MIGILTFACVVLVGAVIGSGLTMWILSRVVLDPERFATFLSGYLQQFSRSLEHQFLSTVDDEGRLVLIPVERLARSLETQLPLWVHPPVTAPERIHLDPPEGSH